MANPFAISLTPNIVIELLNCERCVIVVAIAVVVVVVVVAVVAAAALYKPFTTYNIVHTMIEV